MRVIYICPESALRYLCVHIFFLLALPPVCHASVCRVQKTHLMDRNGPNAKKKSDDLTARLRLCVECMSCCLPYELPVIFVTLCSSDFFAPACALHVWWIHKSWMWNVGHVDYTPNHLCQMRLCVCEWESQGTSSTYHYLCTGAAQSF